ncbi:MAG: TolC family protein [Bacteroidales bacterium]|nr:TolC family protein [Bacteroidales bacterium]
MKINFILIWILILGISVKAQTDSVYHFSINEAVSFAIENNINVQNSELDIKKAKWKVWETTAIGLPQVSGSVKYQNFPDIPTQLMPNFIMPAVIGVNTQYFGLIPTAPIPDEGEKFEVQFGSKHNADWGISVSQIIFSGEYIVGLQAARTYKLISEQNYEKAKIEIKSTVEQAYFLALIAKQSLSIMQQNYANIEKLLNDTQKMVDAGVAEQTQADQVKILQLNLKNQISSLKRQEQLSTLMINLQLGLLPTDSVNLTSTLPEVINNLSIQLAGQSFDVNSNIDYQMMNTQVQLKTLDLRRSQSTALPTVVGFYSYSQQAMRDEFNFLDNSYPWFPTSVVGVKVEIPIFSSGQRTAVIQQKKIELYQAVNQQTLLDQQLSMQFIQTKSDFLNAYDNFLSQEQNMNLSLKIYNDTQIKFKQGTSSSMDLTSVQNQYLQAEANYYQALMQLLNSKTALEKLINQ